MAKAKSVYVLSSVRYGTLGVYSSVHKAWSHAKEKFPDHGIRTYSWLAEQMKMGGSYLGGLTPDGEKLVDFYLLRADLDEPIS